MQGVDGRDVYGPEGNKGAKVRMSLSLHYTSSI